MSLQAQISSPTAIHPALTNLSDHPALRPEGLKKRTSVSDRPKSSSAAFRQHQQLPPPSGTLSLDTNTIDNVQQNDEPWSASALLGPSAATTTDAALGPASTQPFHHHPPSGHRKNALSIESVPRQTVIKALASVARKNKPEALSLAGMLSAQNMPPNRATLRTSGPRHPRRSSSAMRSTGWPTPSRPGPST